MFARIAFVGFVVSLTSFAGAQSPEQPPVDVELAARSFRIQLYMTHQHDRDAYLRGRAAADQAFKAWQRAGSPAPEAMAGWYRSARTSIVQGAALPATPAFPEQLVTDGGTATPVSKRSRRRRLAPTEDVATETPSPTPSVLATETSKQPEPTSSPSPAEPKPVVAATKSQSTTVHAKASDMLRALWDAVSPETPPTSEPEPLPEASKEVATDGVAPIGSEASEPTEPPATDESAPPAEESSENPSTESVEEPKAEGASSEGESSEGELPPATPES